MSKSVAIIGGGAAGFFTAINIAEQNPNLDVTIYEGSNKLLTKVLVSGGGRCNVTNVISDPIELTKQYPRGHDFLLPVFEQFSSDDTERWFIERGVPLKCEDDGRKFPQTNSSHTIFNCLTTLAREHNVVVKLSHRLENFTQVENGWQLQFNRLAVTCDYLVLCTGSSPSIYNLLGTKDIEIVPPLPSLFTFKAKDHSLVDLAGVSVEKSSVSIKEIKNSSENGPLLITHAGYSAPAVIKISAWYARELSQLDYRFTLVINWGSYDANRLRELFKSYTVDRPKERIMSWKEHGLSKRLWLHLCQVAELKEYTNWSEIGKKGIQRLTSALCQFESQIAGKSTFKEEFVTAGGIDLSVVEPDSFKIKGQPNLYAAGELLNIDAVTGGFNFQAAWSGAFIAARSIALLSQ